MAMHFKTGMAFLLACSLSCLLVACGGGSSGSSSASASANTGRYVDAPTAGLHYSASPSGLSGVTDVNGNFQFKTGDRVTFSVVSSDGTVTIPMGTISPSTPVTNGQAAIVSVLTLPNGNETAQAIQSFATGGSDFRSVSISAGNALALKSFIESGGVTTTPTPPIGSFVHADVALNTALQYVANLSLQAAPDVNAAISGKTFFSVSTFTDSGNTVHPNGNIVYLAPNGNYYEICVNTIFDGLTPNPCAVNNGNPLSHVGSWAVVSNTANTFTLTGDAYDATNGTTHYVSTITAPVMDASKGIFTTSQTNDGVTASGTGVGKYQNVQSTLNVDALAGKSFSVAGMSTCTNGQRLYTFGQVTSGNLPYTSTCPNGYASGGSVNGVATNVSVASTTIPGVVLLTDNGATDPLYIGITNDSSLSNGVAMVAKVGNSGSGCSYASPSNCQGFVKSRAFTLQ